MRGGSVRMPAGAVPDRDLGDLGRERRARAGARRRRRRAAPRTGRRRRGRRRRPSTMSGTPSDRDGEARCSGGHVQHQVGGPGGADEAPKQPQPAVPSMERSRSDEQGEGEVERHRVRRRPTRSGTAMATMPTAGLDDAEGDAGGWPPAARHRERGGVPWPRPPARGRASLPRPLTTRTRASRWRGPAREVNGGDPGAGTRVEPIGPSRVPRRRRPTFGSAGRTPSGWRRAGRSRRSRPASPRMPDDPPRRCRRRPRTPTTAG